MELIIDYDKTTLPPFFQAGEPIFTTNRKGKWRLDLSKMNLLGLDSMNKPGEEEPWDEWDGRSSGSVIESVTQDVANKIHGDFQMFTSIQEWLLTSPTLTRVLFGKQLRHGAFIFFPHTLAVHRFMQSVERAVKVKEPKSGGTKTVVEHTSVPRQNRTVLGLGMNVCGGVSEQVKWIGHQFTYVRADEPIGMFHALCYWLFVESDGLQPF